MTEISLHFSSDISSGQEQVRPPLGVGKHRKRHPPLFSEQALFTAKCKKWKTDRHFTHKLLAINNV